MKTSVRVVQIRDPMLAMDTEKLQWLSEEEWARYLSITAPQRKQQFLAGHYLVRIMASHHFKNSFDDWVYFVDAEYLRRLKCRHEGYPELYVSLSHSGDWIAAVISNKAVGIDIEANGKQRDYIAIASHVFSRSETDLLKAVDPKQLSGQFYLYWTLKECVAKQYGAGLKFEMSRAHSMIPAIEPTAASIFSWQCPDYVFAIACESNSGIVVTGLCEASTRLCWQNIPG